MVELFIARRYLVPKRGRGLLSLITWISVGGVALGVLALIVVLSVMNGFEREVKSRIVGTNAHVTLMRYGGQGLEDPPALLAAVRGHPQVVAAAPFVYGKAMISGRGGADGIVIKGIEPGAALEVTSLIRYVEGGMSPEDLDPGGGELPGIILGVHVADQLQVTIGERVQLMAPQVGAVSPLGYVPRVRNYRVAGLFRSGMYEYDASLAFVSLAQAQAFFGLGPRISAIEVKVREMYAAPRVAEELVARLGGFPYRSQDWIEMNANLFSWMQTEKRVMFVILALIVTIAAFNILAALIMLVKEKRRDIGILRSMGATTPMIRGIFVAEGAIIGGTGMILGGAGGLLLCYLLERYKFIPLPGDIYFIDTLPVRVETLDVAAVLASVLLICVLATLYPARQAARLHPVEAIRHGE